MMAPGGWVDRTAEPYKWNAYLCETVGFLLYDGPEGIVVTDSVAPEHMGPPTQIPRGVIRTLLVQPDEVPVAKPKRKSAK